MDASANAHIGFISFECFTDFLAILLVVFGTTANAKRNNFTAIHTNKLASEWKASKKREKMYWAQVSGFEPAKLSYIYKCASVAVVICVLAFEALLFRLPSNSSSALERRDLGDSLWLARQRAELQNNCPNLPFLRLTICRLGFGWICVWTCVCVSVCG